MTLKSFSGGFIVAVAIGLISYAAYLDEGLSVGLIIAGLSYGTFGLIMILIDSNDSDGNEEGGE